MSRSRSLVVWFGACFTVLITGVLPAAAQQEASPIAADIRTKLKKLNDYYKWPTYETVEVSEVKQGDKIAHVITMALKDSGRDRMNNCLLLCGQVVGIVRRRFAELKHSRLTMKVGDEVYGAALPTRECVLMLDAMDLRPADQKAVLERTSQFLKAAQLVPISPQAVSKRITDLAATIDQMLGADNYTSLEVVHVKQTEATYVLEMKVKDKDEGRINRCLLVGGEAVGCALEQGVKLEQVAVIMTTEDKKGLMSVVPMKQARDLGKALLTEPRDESAVKDAMLRYTMATRLITVRPK